MIIIKIVRVSWAQTWRTSYNLVQIRKDSNRADSGLSNLVLVRKWELSCEGPPLCPLYSSNSDVGSQNSSCIQDKLKPANKTFMYLCIGFFETPFKQIFRKILLVKGNRHWLRPQMTFCWQNLGSLIDDLQECISSQKSLLVRLHIMTQWLGYWPTVCASVEAIGCEFSEQSGEDWNSWL
jgi:hypothetical protein